MDKTKMTEEDALTLLTLTQLQKTVEHNAEVLTAEKARGISQAAILSIAEERIDKLMEAIFETAMNGGHTVENTFAPTLSREKINTLIERYFVRLGYIVTVEDRTFHISW
jgi:hypothetical protein